MLRFLVWLLAIRRSAAAYPVLCALQIGNGVLPRLRPCAFPSPSFRRCPPEQAPSELRFRCARTVGRSSGAHRGIITQSVRPLHAAADEPSSTQKHHHFVNADRGSAALSRFVPSAIFSLKIVFTEGENTMKRDIFLSTVAAALNGTAAAITLP